jgi:cysteine desulfurase/selenocysteine lyase
MNDRGELLLEEFETILAGGRVKIVSIVHLSNSLGTINDVERITRMAHARGAKVIIDGAQWVAHHKTDVRAIDCDFYAFSGHKIFGPTGIGVLYGKSALLEAMPPYQGGGDMIASVTFDKTTYADLPNKFEAGTPDIAGVVGLGAAIDYLAGIGLGNIEPYEANLLAYATAKMSEVPGLRIVGQAARKGSVISFVIENPPLASHDIGVILDLQGIAVRTGHHCCQPAMDRLGISSTARASLAMYNTRDDIDALVSALREATSKSTTRTAAKASAPASGEVQYPKAAAASVAKAADALVEDFEFMGDATAKNEYVLDLGAKLPALFNLLKIATRGQRVQGCMAEVYLVARRVPDDPTRMEFVADADAHIVRGLIAIMQRLFSGQKASEILGFDVEAFFRRIGLDSFITTQRRNGLAGMVKRIRQFAEEFSR